MKLNFLILFISSFILSGCGDESFQRSDQYISLSSAKKYSRSTTSGNLMATAIRKKLDVDVALYPSAFLSNEKIAYVKPGMNQSEINNVLEIYPDGPEDKFLVGNMQGKKLKEFIFDRVSEKYTAELQVAGVLYDIRFTGGIPGVTGFSRERGLQLNDDEFYKVAISNYFFFSGKTFPSYKYRNGMGNYSFKRFNDDLYSAREALKGYLETINVLPFLEEIRANVVNNSRDSMFVKVPNSARSFNNLENLEKHPRFVGISRIQGKQHRSPFYGHRVVTRGIVTAVNNSQWYPWGIDLYIQDANGDDDPKTSDAIHVHLADERYELELGDELVIAGTVFEQVLSEGLSKTSIRNVSKLKVMSRGNPLPKAVELGINGRAIPKDRFSSWVGNLNLRPELKLSDAIDFWESLEGMRIKIQNPRVLGFRGGAEELETDDNKDYISIFIRPDGDIKDPNDTQVGGLRIHHPTLDFNPEILQLTTHHLTRGLTKDDFFNVGDLIEGDLEGVFAYEKNLFGGGDFMFLLPEAEPEIQASKISKLTPLENRPTTKYPASDDQYLSIASYNVKNLAGNQPERIELTAQMITGNLKCPDILTLVEIQDENGVDFFGGGTAEVTIKKVVQATSCLKKHNVDYQLVNIDPITHKEGGQPGGNIRVAMIYNANKVEFEYRVGANADTEYTHLKEDGSLSHNPGRVYAQNKHFASTRKSLVVEFKYQGKKLFVFGNHLNSKLGDSSHYSAEQPFDSGSEQRRIPRANLINRFIQMLERTNEGALIAVTGDFNAYYTERSMKVLAGNELYNLITYKNMIPYNERYTTNHNGNSQPLDYIFINKEFAKYHPKPEVLHINSNYMGRVSDHDPFLVRFDFNDGQFKKGRCGRKIVKRYSNLFKRCDVNEAAESELISIKQKAQSCIQEINQLLSARPDINCKVNHELGHTKTSFQFNVDYLVKMIQKIQSL